MSFHVLLSRCRVIATFLGCWKISNNVYKAPHPPQRWLKVIINSLAQVRKVFIISTVQYLWIISSSLCNISSKETKCLLEDTYNAHRMSGKSLPLLFLSLPFSLFLFPPSAFRSPFPNPDCFVNSLCNWWLESCFDLFIKLLAFARTSLSLRRLQFFFSQIALFIIWLRLEAGQFAGDRKMLKNTANKTHAE